MSKPRKPPSARREIAADAPGFHDPLCREVTRTRPQVLRDGGLLAAMLVQCGIDDEHRRVLSLLDVKKWPPSMRENVRAIAKRIKRAP